MGSPLKTSADFPLNLGSHEEFTRVAGLLHATGLSETSICDRLGINELGQIDSPFIRKTAEGLRSGGDALAAWILLFVQGNFVDRGTLEARITREDLEAFRTLDLIRLDEEQNGYFSPVRLVSLKCFPCATEELLIVSDRTNNPDGSAIRPAPDIVFSAHNPLTRQFLGILPVSRTGAVLDLCTGTGVAGLAAASSAERVIAVDIAGRSAHFARFNCLLNAITNVEIRAGDLYDPVEGSSFDRIFAHPPYVPSYYDSPIYRDGGETGDKVVRRILEGVPDHLNPGGTFRTLGIAMDADGKLFEERARQWMGNRQDFDLVFALKEPKEPEDFGRLLGSRNLGAELQVFERWSALAKSLRIDNVVYGALVGRRHQVPGSPHTRRVQFGSGVNAESFDRLFRWFDWLRLPDVTERILGTELRIPRDSRLEVTYSAGSGQFEPERFLLISGDRMFPTRIQAEAWVTSAVSCFGGGKRALEVYSDMTERQRLPPDLGKSEFAELLLWLVERDILRISGAD